MWAFKETRAMKIRDFFESMFKQVEVVENYSNSYLYKVSREDFSIGYLFGLMEDNKDKYEISEYSVSKTSLDQIFNDIARGKVSLSIIKNDYRILLEEHLITHLEMKQVLNATYRLETIQYLTLTKRILLKS